MKNKNGENMVEDLNYVVSRADLRKLIDSVWNQATDSEQVPSTKWADVIIDAWFSQVLQEWVDQQDWADHKQDFYRNDSL